MQLKKEIKSGDFKNAYLFYGEESYLKEYYANELKNKIVDKTFEAFNYHSFDGKDTELDDILKDAQMLPMMSEYNFVLVKDYPIEKSSNDIKLLEEYLSDAPDSTVLVFWFDALDPDVKSAKFKKVIKAFEKAGNCVELQKKCSVLLTKWLLPLRSLLRRRIRILIISMILSLLSAALMTLWSQMYTFPRATVT